MADVNEWRYMDGVHYVYHDGNKPQKIHLSLHSLEPEYPESPIIQDDAGQGAYKEADGKKEKVNREEEILDGKKEKEQDPTKYGSAVQKTLDDAIYNDGTRAPFYILYNDQVPGRAVSTDSYGHAKGVVAFDGKTGLWLVHSVPNFPNSSGEGYGWPESGKKNGQVFFCLTLDTEGTADVVLRQLVMRQVYAYEVEGRDFFPQPDIKLLVEEIFDKKVTLSRSAVIPTLYPDGTTELDTDQLTIPQNKQEENPEQQKKLKQQKKPQKPKQQKKQDIGLHLFAKTQAAGVNMYLWIARHLEIEELYVQTWRQGSGGKMNSYCRNRLHVMNIKMLQFKNLKLRPFKHTQDHSKWAVGRKGGQSSIVCIADTNRVVRKSVLNNVILLPIQTKQS